MTPQQLRAVRERRGLSQQAMAAQLGLQRRQYQRLESGASPILRRHELAVQATEPGVEAVAAE